MPEILNYVPAKEGLAALDSFIAGKAGFFDLTPFTRNINRRVIIKYLPKVNGKVLSSSVIFSVKSLDISSW